MRPACIAVLLILPTLCCAQFWPITRAEKTNYQETSHYADVIDFLRDLQLAGGRLSVQMMGKSAEGREMPLVIASNPPVSSPAEARRLGKPIVYIQANIHAGEVEGKEAALMYLRELLRQRGGVLDKVVLLMTPIYNIDGNENFGPVAKNRPEQDGPVEVGLRPNGQGFDLNRDAIKAESPEMDAVLKYVYTTWDPDVMMDLHTTDGTRHGWELTYSSPLNPDTDPDAMKLARDVIIPDIRKQIESRTGKLLFDYGNVETRAGKRSWYSFEPFGRYCTNYVGLRNRIAILSEATTYIPFRDRVKITYDFVAAVVGWVAAHPDQVIDATRGADARMTTDPPKELGVRFGFASRGEETVLLEHPVAGESAPFGRPKSLDKVKMQIYDRFVPTRMARMPGAYIISGDETPAAQLLRRHGIVVERILQPLEMEIETFSVKQLQQAARPFQGHKLITLDGSFNSGKSIIPAGDYLVRTNQPLGRLAFLILEPESEDGAAAWGFLPGLAVGAPFPIMKSVSTFNAITERLP